MMKNRGLYFLIGGLLYIVVSGLYMSKMVVIAKELKENVEQFDYSFEDDNFEASDPEGNKEALTDVIEPIYLSGEYGEEDSEDQEPDEPMTENNDNEFKYMLIFALGTISGVLTGHILFGWIK